MHAILLQHFLSFTISSVRFLLIMVDSLRESNLPVKILCVRGRQAVPSRLGWDRELAIPYNQGWGAESFTA